MDGTKKFGRERGNLDFREEVGFRETSYLKVLNRSNKNEKYLVYWNFPLTFCVRLSVGWLIRRSDNAGSYTSMLLGENLFEKGIASPITLILQ